MAVTMKREITQELLDRCERHVDGNGQPFYTMTSESDPTGEGFYTIRFPRVGRFDLASDNCRAGCVGSDCYHKRTAILKERAIREAEEGRGAEEVAEQSMIERLIGQGVSRADATRIAYAKPASTKVRGVIRTADFSLLK